MLTPTFLSLGFNPDSDTTCNRLVRAILGKVGPTRDFGLMLSQHEALRRATLIKHRKVSTQLKLDMVQRQLSDLRRTSPDSDSDRDFYRQQVTELSNELHDLGATLDRVERNAFYAKRRMLRQNGLDISNSDGAISLYSSHPALYTSSENLSRTSSRSSLKSKVCHLMSSPNFKLKKKHLWGELRSVASLSSLNIKSGSPSSEDDGSTGKDTKAWKAPLKFLGKMVDSRFRKKFWNPAKRTKSCDNIVDNNNRYESSAHTNFEIKNCKSFDSPDVRCHIDSSSSSSEESSDEEIEVENDWKLKPVPKYQCKAPVMRRISSNNNNNNNNSNNNVKVQVDPAIMAEIEDFEKMAALYIQQHS